MPTYHAHIEATITAESESAARQTWIDEGPDALDSASLVGLDTAAGRTVYVEHTVAVYAEVDLATGAVERVVVAEDPGSPTGRVLDHDLVTTVTGPAAARATDIAGDQYAWPPWEFGI